MQVDMVAVGASEKVLGGTTDSVSGEGMTGKCRSRPGGQAMRCAPHWSWWGLSVDGSLSYRRWIAGIAARVRT